jgi:hypothetical protein
MKNLEYGYYWTKIKGEWKPSFYFGGIWVIMGSNTCVNDSFFEDIKTEKIKLPDSFL